MRLAALRESQGNDSGALRVMGQACLQAEAEQRAAEAKLAAQGKARLMHGGKADEAIVRELVDRHLRYTASSVALRILDNWDSCRGKFVKVFPHEYKRVLGVARMEASNRG